MICIFNTKLDSIIRSIKTAPLLQSGPVDSVIALDPGVSEFLVGYAPDGTVLQVGTNTTKVLDKCLRRVARARNRKVKFIADSARMLAEDVGIRRRTQAVARL